MYRFEGASANEVWLEAAKAAMTDGTQVSSRAGPTIELLHAAFQIHNPRDRWVTWRKPAMNVAFALAEVVWILNGREDSAFLNFWNRALPRYAGRDQSYHGAYGRRLRDWLGLDQIVQAADVLARDPESRQVVLQIWDPNRDLPSEAGPCDTDVPCNVAATLKVRNGQLHWLQLVRSNDLFLGVPHNFVQFTILQEVLSGWIGVEPGTYAHMTDSLHVYVRDIDTVRLSTAKEPSIASDPVSLPRSTSERGLQELDVRARAMTRLDIGPSELIALVADFPGPAPYHNWLRVLAAEAARRKGWHDLSQKVGRLCTDRSLLALWTNWSARVSTSAQAESSDRAPTDLAHV